jgi:hypothetical protein
MEGVGSRQPGRTATRHRYRLAPGVRPESGLLERWRAREFPSPAPRRHLMKALLIAAGVCFRPHGGNGFRR